MDIFNGNRKLEELTMYTVDWGIFLRHNSDGPIAPFMHLINGGDMQVRILMTDGDPVEYARSILAKEDKPYQQFVIGMEGYLRDENNVRVDAIIVHGYDVTQEKGVVLAQKFEPKEQQGTFKKIDGITYLGSPELPVSLNRIESPDYTVEEVGFNAMALKFGELTQYMAFFTHENPSVIANTIKRFLRSKLTGNNASSLNGRFELLVTPDIVKNDNLLKFLVLTAIDEERATPQVKAWESQTGRKLLINLKHGETAYLTEFVEDKPVQTELEKPKPHKSSEPSTLQSEKKPWWKFW